MLAVWIRKFIYMKPDHDLGREFGYEVDPMPFLHLLIYRKLIQ